jgi:predicted esterase
MTVLFSLLLYILHFLLGLLQFAVRVNNKLFTSFAHLLIFLDRFFRQSACTVLIIAAAIVFTLLENTSPAIDLSKSTGDLSYYDGLGNVMPYRLFVPDGYASGQKLPLVLFLHGSTDGGTFKHIDNLFYATQGNFGAQYKSFLLVPQVQVPPGNYSWNDDVSENMAMKILDLITASYNVDTSRIYLTGLSMGGFGTWDYIADYPHKFAAAAPLSGGGDPSTASLIRDIPIWAYHGVADTTVPVTYTDEMFDAVEAAGGNMEYTRVDGVGHSGWETFYDGSTYKNSRGQTVYQWMFAQSLPVPEPSSIYLAATGIFLAFSFFLRRRLSGRGVSCDDRCHILKSLISQ